jgi:hypothetical protein
MTKPIYENINHTPNLLCNCAQCGSPVMNQDMEDCYSYACSNWKNCHLGTKVYKTKELAAIAWYELNNGINEIKNNKTYVVINDTDAESVKWTDFSIELPNPGLFKDYFIVAHNNKSELFNIYYRDGVLLNKADNKPMPFEDLVAWCIIPKPPKE